MWFQWHHKWHCMCINDITSAELHIKGAMEIFDTQQHFRPDNLTAYVQDASQVIRHSLSHFKIKVNHCLGQNSIVHKGIVN